jgi:hypothetical protein
MQFFSRPVTEIIKERFSCRIYREEPIRQDQQDQIKEYLAAIQYGPHGTPMRFDLVAATDEDRSSLNGLGTYGFIQGATGFILGAMSTHVMDLEDYGYILEKIILFMTDLGLGTCWLGGTFVKSNFAKKIILATEERMPAVISTGLIADLARTKQAQKMITNDNRLPWEQLFFNRGFGSILTEAAAGNFSLPLEMLRIGPSASNNQPWRIIKDNNAWHFYLQRTKGYLESFPLKLLRLEDLQRVDMGIAMCHFDLTVKELGLAGKWEIDEPSIEKPDDMTEYTISWIATS